MIVACVIAGAVGFIIVVAVWRVAYAIGVEHGRWAQATEDRREVEHAVIAKARAEQCAETWERRARALLRAHFGPERP